MKISFKQEKEPEKQPKLGDVELSQFFVDTDGDLCQKTGNNRYQVIATRKGIPWTSACDVERFGGDAEIQRILPRVDKIEF